MTEFVRGMVETGDPEKAAGLMFERSTPEWQDGYLDEEEPDKFPNGDYKTKAPELGALNNFNEGYEKCDFHKLTGWGNWLSTNSQQLNKNPEKGGGGKLEDSAKN
jgi:hypothetical protein